MKRRNLLRMLGGGVIAASASNWLTFPRRVAAAGQPEVAGERFDEFLLMPFGGNPGSAVTVPEGFHMPVVCQLPAGRLSTAAFLDVDLREARNRLKLPLYGVEANLQEIGTEIFGDVMGGTVSVRTRYGDDLRLAKPSTEAVSLSYLPKHQKPFPVWPSGNPEIGLRMPERVQFLPRPGICRRAGYTESAMWIEPDGLHIIEINTEATALSLADVAAHLRRD